MKLITIKEVSKILGIKVSTLYSWASSGMIPSHRLNGLIRFDMDKIYEWVRGQNTYNTKGRASHKKTCKNKELSAIITNVIEAENVTRYNPRERGNQTIQAGRGGKNGAF